MIDIDEIRKKANAKSYVCITTDLDWAPECAIKKEIDYLLLNGIRPTIYATHNSEYITKKMGQLDVGIHPNFIQPSSHGENEDKIVQYCKQLKHNIKSFRAHRWYASNDVYDRLVAQGYLFESNLCTDLEILNPFLHRSGIVSFPVFMEDGAYIISKRSFDIKSIKEKLLCRGLKVINIHPMHYALNTPYFRYTRKIKDSLSWEEWNGMTEDTLLEIRNESVGIASFIEDIITFCRCNSIEFVTLQQAYGWGISD